MPNKVIPIITEGETDGCIVDAFEEAFYSERLSFTGVASGGDITLYKIHPEFSRPFWCGNYRKGKNVN